MNQTRIGQADDRQGTAVSISSYAWIILFAVFIASVAAPLNQNKVPPLMPVLMQTLDITLSQAGLLMSVFSITGFVLALPTGFIIQRFGPKITGIIALVSLVIGAGLGALSGSMGLLLASRVIEGVGMGLIAVVAPAVIALWFPREKQGTPMGIWATWVPMGSILMLQLAPRLSASFGWPSVWWFGAVFALVALLLFAFLLRMPPVDPGLLAEAAPPAPSFGKALANRDIWLLAFTFFCFNLVFFPLATYYPTFLSEVRGYSLTEAASIASISTAVVLISAPFAGWLSDRIGSRKLVLTIPFILVAGLMFLPFRVVGWQIIAFFVVLGLIAGAVPTATFAAAPEVMQSPQLAGLGLAVIMLGQNLGMFVAPMMFGALVESSGWVTAGLWLIPFALLGFVAGRLVKMR
ncbi:MAG: MFS transporter [Ardenticatenaceae bacterium]|nr:MFS transporter [Ardenticatenaceae bacterium]